MVTTRTPVRWAGAFAVVAALIVAGGVTYALTNEGPTSGSTADQPTTSGTDDDVLASAFVAVLDLTTGETSTTQIVSGGSAIDASPDGGRITYVDEGVVRVADIDGSNVQVLEGTRGDPTGPQWSPDGSSIVYQDGRVGSSIGNLYVVDVGSGQVRRITDLEGVETDKLYYMSPTFDPSGGTVLFNMPTADGERERYDLWAVPVTGGEPALVRRAATFGDYSPDGTQIAFVEDGGFGDLFVAPSAGGKARKLASGDPGGVVVPRWSPDGTRIAYNDGSGGVYVVDVETGEQTLIVESERLPAWVDDDTLSLTP